MTELRMSRFFLVVCDCVYTRSASNQACAGVNGIKQSRGRKPAVKIANDPGCSN